MNEIIIVLGSYFISLAFCSIFLPKLPDGYDTEWEESVFVRYRKARRTLIKE